VQIILLVLWYTAFPTLPAWLVFIPLMLWGIGVVIAITIVLGALIVAGKSSAKYTRTK
jgi:hypothetical protein